MPVYTYRCQDCGVQFEIAQKFTDLPLEQCPECGKKALRKVYLPVGIVFKGSGFYATDHKSPSGAPRNSGSSESRSNGEMPVAESKETKPVAEKSTPAANEGKRE